MLAVVLSLAISRSGTRICGSRAPKLEAFYCFSPARLVRSGFAFDRRCGELAERFSSSQDNRERTRKENYRNVQNSATRVQRNERLPPRGSSPKRSLVASLMSNINDTIVVS